MFDQTTPDRPQQPGLGDQETRFAEACAAEDADREGPSTPEASSGAETPVDEDDFASLLAQSEEQPAREPRAGERVEGKIVQITASEAFVDCGGRSELPLDVAEIKDKEDNLTHAVGDTITAHVMEKGGEKRLTLSLSLRDAGREALLRAHEEGAPVRGTVRQTNKGGFTVDLGGIRGFCPFSQMDLRRVEDPSVYVGNEFSFKILEVSPDQRNVVVSRRALLIAERSRLAADTRQELALGLVRKGVVTRVVPFGAFVDIGGVEGLVHISQISHQRVADPAEHLVPGQEVSVQVIEIENLGQGRRERIGLSMKALARDPWPDAVRELKPGMETTGTVVRLVDFGAFVEVRPGVTGLVHVSELGQERIRHPREILQPGQEVIVRVLNIDVDRRRLSLSLKEIQTEPPEEPAGPEDSPV
jgi:small subunit ribosomal protein S1